MTLVGNLVRTPYFWLGATLKIACVVVGSAYVVDTWYAPFLVHVSEGFLTDPWSTWALLEGDPAAFPYGPAMLLALSPAAVAGSVSPSLVVPAYFGLLLVADFALMVALVAVAKCTTRTILLTYWLSPIVLTATFLFGYNDVIPVLALSLGLLLLRRSNWFWAGIVVAVAMSMKLSMALALPFILIYFMRNRSTRKGLVRFAGAVFSTSVVLWVPLAWSSGAMQMIFTNREASKVLGLDLTTTSGISIFLVPLAYILVLYSASSARRMNASLMATMLGLGFLAVVLLAPSPPGWFIWVVPLLTLYGADGGAKARSLVFVFAFLFVVYAVYYEAWPQWAITVTSAWDGRIPEAASSLGASVAKTALVATGLVLGLRIWRDAIQRNDLLRLSKRPFGIGIAGDSGTGKDTLAESLVGAFGPPSVAHVSGDDYHIWDRGQPMWKALTHLNPRANDLDRFTSDIAELMSGKRVWVRPYDHRAGKRTPQIPINSREYIVITGLHALYSEQLRSMYEVSVYLDMDEELRRLLKIRRDTTARGSSLEHVELSLDRRLHDAARFVHPQRRYADLVMTVKPLDSLEKLAANPTVEPRTFLEATSRMGFDERMLARVLIGLCGLRVDFIHSEGTSESRVIIEGDISKEDVALAARLGCPRMMDFLDSEPHWQGGTRGLQLLLLLMTAEQAMTRRLVA